MDFFTIYKLSAGTLWQFMMSIESAFCNNYCCIKLVFRPNRKGVEQKMPKFMEWFGAMGLMITLVWLYIEFLRLLSKLSSKD
jgi:uncharacterized YccA/Bax inhibitor family protein